MRRLFTLVELLVVIAIIMVLAGLLLPSLKTAQMKAREIKCTGNLRQIYAASMSYAGDYDEMLPPPSVGSGWSPWCYWSLLLFNHVKGLTFSSNAINSATDIRWNGSIFNCPFISPMTSNFYSNYGINYLIYPPYNKPGGAPWGTPWETLRLSKISQPGRVRYIADSKTWIIGTGGYFRWHAGLHTGDMLFCDGHASTISTYTNTLAY